MVVASLVAAFLIDESKLTVERGFKTVDDELGIPMLL
jgi:hypothetical protein